MPVLICRRQGRSRARGDVARNKGNEGRATASNNGQASRRQTSTSSSLLQAPSLAKSISTQAALTRNLKALQGRCSLTSSKATHVKMSQAQEPSASQHQLQQPTDEPKVLGGGNMDPTNPLAGLENPEAEAKATEMGASIPSQGPEPELSEEPITEPASSGGSQNDEDCGSQQATQRETVQESGSQAAPGSQA